VICIVEENSNMLLGTADKPTSLRWLLLAIQHVCAMFGATILVPIVVNTTAGADILSIPVALVSSGIGTLIYLICTRNRSPVYLGSSFAFIAPMVAGYAIGGYWKCIHSINDCGYCICNHLTDYPYDRS
jgi:uracil permease